MRYLTLALATLALIVAGCKSAPKAETAPQKAKQGFEAAKSEAKAQVDAAAGKVEKSAATGSTSKLECTNKTDIRLLEVRSKDKGCELAYTKNGQEAVVSTARNGSEHCQGSLDKIKEKLIAAGFTCK